ncbi:glutathione S-transferase family protein [Spirulina sp. 06S082]|uniref:glutathione S-transferase family protein n=1 Tax=Spirulina sp. 06S082 TaxID=3110248 RepID=UPI002B2137FC|nr:glutathione S-transferase family protein [Spirulina sp. 06S082]MEA5468800.1 glutathione S-transferase family protein [Spirulina sp. 06S082]
MIKLYNSHISSNTRRVWVALLEKNLEFEEIFIQLNKGEQFTPEFLEINPFHHIPVLIDDGFKVFESLAILDYLEAKYPHPQLMPTDAESIAKVRMIELVTLNELIPPTFPLMRKILDFEVPDEQLEKSQKQVANVLQFFEDQLDENQPYFLGDRLTLADVVAGTTVPTLFFFGISLSEYPKITKWCETLQQRESWQKTTPSPEAIEAAKAGMKKILQQRS